MLKRLREKGGFKLQGCRHLGIFMWSGWVTLIINLQCVHTLRGDSSLSPG